MTPQRRSKVVPALWPLCLAASLLLWPAGARAAAPPPGQAPAKPKPAAPALPSDPAPADPAPADPADRAPAKPAPADPAPPADAGGASDDAKDAGEPSDGAADAPDDAGQPPGGAADAPDDAAGDAADATADSPAPDGGSDTGDTKAAAASSDADKAAAARARYEEDQPRPAPLADVALPPSASWTRRLEIGADFAVVFRFPAGQQPAAAGQPGELGYRVAPAWGLHLAWPVFSWLRVKPYFLDVHHDLDVPPGILAVPGEQISEATVETFVFGAKVSPTLPITDRFRVWATAGIGWGRFEFQEITVCSAAAALCPAGDEAGDGEIRIRERAGTLLEFPLGLGLAFDIWPRWLAIEYEVTAAPFTAQSGAAYEPAQAVDGGELRDVPAFNPATLSVVQTLGLSLIL